ncbi:parathyroid hormone 4-like [Dryobates pubescens]|uniref:parathyroid hormone 4-like n=1 Tax=Dryobates pubescens TaxID=118200 RepID=UPI0023B9257E|nr:parathyroid hormone 4-like [Dryobates pubescens]
MFLPQRALQLLTLLAVLFFACFATCQDTERRAVTEHQLMHDKGRAFQGLKRLLWLHQALGSVHTASSRDVPLADALWDSRASQDPSDQYSLIDREETARLRKLLQELMEEEQGSPRLKQLEYVKTPKANWNPQDLVDLLQIKELGSKRAPVSQPQHYSH